jgi:hypothetical protein
MMDTFIMKGTPVSIRARNGDVLFGKYVKEGRNGYHTIETTDGNKFDRKLDKIKIVSEDDISSVGDKTAADLGVTTVKMTPPKQFDINDKFRFLENMVGMVVKNTAVSMIITGEGGLGKTFTVMKEIKKRDLVEEFDFTVIKGYSTPRGLYRTLYENSDKLIVFDDCDEVLKDPTAKNLLKGALDSYDERKISWITNKELPDLPSDFEFNGRIIFISNLAPEKIEQAILSRSMSIDLSMTPQVKIERMRNILDKIRPDVPLDIKEECLDLLDDNKQYCQDLNFRTLMKIIGMRTDPDNSADWYDMAIYAMTCTVN